MEYRLTAPMTREQARQLRCGDTVLFTGTIYTARDAAHKRLVELLDRGEPLPFDVNGAVIYYAGPTPAQKGHAVGSCGPTTSYRMDAYAPKVICRREVEDFPVTVVIDTLGRNLYETGRKAYLASREKI